MDKIRNSKGNKIIPDSLIVVEITKNVEAIKIKCDLFVFPNFIKKYAP